MVYTILGSVPWAIGLLYAGMLLGENWHEIEALGHNASLVVGVGLILMGMLWLRQHKSGVHAG